MHNYIIFKEISFGIYVVCDSTYSLKEGQFVKVDTVLMYLNDSFYEDVSIRNNEGELIFRK